MRPASRQGKTFQPPDRLAPGASWLPGKRRQRAPGARPGRPYKRAQISHICTVTGNTGTLKSATQNEGGYAP
jgi:hypothetical protein